MPLAVGAEGEGGGEVWCLDVRVQSQREAGSEMQKQEEVTGPGLPGSSLTTKTLSEGVGGGAQWTPSYDGWRNE